MSLRGADADGGMAQRQGECLPAVRGDERPVSGGVRDPFGQLTRRRVVLDEQDGLGAVGESVDGRIRLPLDGERRDGGQVDEERFEVDVRERSSGARPAASRRGCRRPG
ncbi:hypothetical protein [Frankia gtarii]|uniref:hypothetical protein n=1 Tax=Frankia gtarii TaxID=2950102 RepID=UPI0021BE164A|nr:hypothetical protein [Frankia gtarii]